jgi:hypothetical protein
MDLVDFDGRRSEQITVPVNDRITRISQIALRAGS